MKLLSTLLTLALSCAWAQGPPGQNPPAQQAPRGTQQTAPVPKPGDLPVPQTIVPPVAPQGQSITLTLAQALQRAGQYSQQVYSAQFAAQLAHEDVVQAKAALLPTATGLSQFIYTQPNGTPSGVFVSN